LPMDRIVARLAGRRVCPGCKGTFHVTDLSSPETCPRCGGKLYQREDDLPEAVRVRKEAYHRSSEPLIKFYRQRGLLAGIAAEGTPQEIFQRTLHALALHHNNPGDSARNS